MGDGRFQNRSYPIKVKFFFDFDGFDFYRVTTILTILRESYTVVFFQRF
jgi:hypothetical protein